MGDLKSLIILTMGAFHFHAMPGADQFDLFMGMRFGGGCLERLRREFHEPSQRFFSGKHTCIFDGCFGGP